MLSVNNQPWGAMKPSRIIELFFYLAAALPKNYFGKRIYFIIRDILRATHRDASFDVVRLNSRLRLNVTGNACERRILFDEYYFDFDEREFLKARLTSNSVFIDAGANIGGYSLYIASAIKGARVIAIEAHPITYARLNFNVISSSEQKIDTVNFALSNETGRLELFIHKKGQSECKQHKSPN
jgi:hypothetical protein